MEPSVTQARVRVDTTGITSAGPAKQTAKAERKSAIGLSATVEPANPEITGAAASRLNNVGESHKSAAEKSLDKNLKKISGMDIESLNARIKKLEGKISEGGEKVGLRQEKLAQVKETLGKVSQAKSQRARDVGRISTMSLSQLEEHIDSLEDYLKNDLKPEVKARQQQLLTMHKAELQTHESKASIVDITKHQARLAFVAKESGEKRAGLKKELKGRNENYVDMIKKNNEQIKKNNEQIKGLRNQILKKKDAGGSRGAVGERLDITKKPDLQADIQDLQKQIDHLDKENLKLDHGNLKLKQKLTEMNEEMQVLDDPKAAGPLIAKCEQKLEEECHLMADSYLIVGHLPNHPPGTFAGLPREIDEKIMFLMAKKCCEDPSVGSVESLSASTNASSGVYKISVKHGNMSTPLFVFKPLDEEPGMKNHLDGQETLGKGSALNQYSVESSSLLNRHTTLGRLQHPAFNYKRDPTPLKLGLITEYVPSHGSLAKKIEPLQSRLQTALAPLNLKEQKMIDAEIAKLPPEGRTPEAQNEIRLNVKNSLAAERETIEKKTAAKFNEEEGERKSFGFDSTAKTSEQHFWKECSRDSVQIMAVVGLLTANADQNQNNALIQDSQVKGSRFELREIDLAEGYPTDWPTGFSAPVFHHTPAVREPLTPASLQIIKSYNAETQIARDDKMRKEKGLEALTERQKTIIRAQERFVKVCLDRGLTLDKMTDALTSSDRSGSMTQEQYELAVLDIAGDIGKTKEARAAYGDQKPLPFTPEQQELVWKRFEERVGVELAKQK